MPALAVVPKPEGRASQALPEPTSVDVERVWLEAAVLAQDHAELFAQNGLPVTTPARVEIARWGVAAGAGDARGLDARYWPHDASSVLGLGFINGNGRTWWHDPDGYPVVLQAVLGMPHLRRPSQIIDVIAWSPAKPDHWRSLTGLGMRLGRWPEEGLGGEWADSVRLVATPKAWLKAPEDGVCLLTLTDELLGELFCYQRVVCDHPDLAGIVRGHFERRLPRVEVG